MSVLTCHDFPDDESARRDGFDNLISRETTLVYTHTEIVRDGEYEVRLTFVGALHLAPFLHVGSLTELQ